jgi:hypothetical protein
LKEVFEIPQSRELTKKEKQKYRKAFKRNCKELVHNYLDRVFVRDAKNAIVSATGKEHFLKFVWNGSNKYFKDTAELFVNLAIKIYENARLSYSDWLMGTSEGRMILDMIVNGDSLNRMYALATLFSMLISIYIKGGYDDSLFKKEMFDFLPSMQKALEDRQFDPISTQIALFLSGTIASSTFLMLMKELLKAHYKVPEEFFKNWSKQIDRPDEDDEKD